VSPFASDDDEPAVATSGHTPGAESESVAGGAAGPAELPADPALFCVRCGARFRSSDERFCTQCGAPRPGA
jgi:hypothetical protein